MKFLVTFFHSAAVEKCLNETFSHHRSNKNKLSRFIERSENLISELNQNDKTKKKSFKAFRRLIKTGGMYKYWQKRNTTLVTACLQHVL